MAEHISRKELKRDEVAETLQHGAEAVMSHQKLLWIACGVTAAVLLAVFGWRFYSERQTTKAAAAFAEARKVFDARIRAVGEPEAPGEITYVAESNKYKDAAEKFAGVAQSYPRTRPGQLARYYAGVCYALLGQNDDAQKWLREAESSSAEDIAALARFQLAGVLAKSGKGEEAAQLYNQLIEKPSILVPKPVVMLALAEYYSKDKPQEATKLYNQVKQDYPNTPAADEAQKRLELLPPVS